MIQDDYCLSLMNYWTRSAFKKFHTQLAHNIGQKQTNAFCFRVQSWKTMWLQRWCNLKAANWFWTVAALEEEKFIMWSHFFFFSPFVVQGAYPHQTCRRVAQIYAGKSCRGHKQHSALPNAWCGGGHLCQARGPGKDCPCLLGVGGADQGRVPVLSHITPQYSRGAFARSLSSISHHSLSQHLSSPTTQGNWNRNKARSIFLWQI